MIEYDFEGYAKSQIDKALSYSEGMRQGYIQAKEFEGELWIKATDYHRQKQEQDWPIQVSIKEFVKAVEGKEDLIGRPVYWAQWPNENAKPQTKEWVGLTLTQVKLLWEGVEKEAIKSGESLNWVFYNHINAALKEKNT